MGILLNFLSFFCQQNQILTFIFFSTFGSPIIQKSFVKIISTNKIQIQISLFLKKFFLISLFTEK